jgi:hypothetical protein
MATTNFIPGTTITSDWCNDLDYLMYTVFAAFENDGAIGADGTILVSDGTNYVEESGATARTSLGLGTGNTPDFAGITLGGVGSTLSNYAEGTFTPTIQDDSRSDAESQAYTTQLGRFTRVGNMYFLTGTIVLSSLGSLTGSEQAVIANIPTAALTAAGESWSFTVGYSNGLAVTAGNYITGVLDSAEQVIKLYKHSATTGATALTLTELSADGHIEFSGIHHV